MIVFKLLVALIYGILEGVTEWLPISSTGHIILLSEFLPLDFSGVCSEELAAEFFEMFEVVIQLGAILAVLVLFFDELNPFCSVRKGFPDRADLWLKLGVACAPSAAVGIALQICFPKLLKGLYNWQTVSAMLIAYGLLFMLADRIADKNEKSEADVSYAAALAIGCFQALSIVPGTSRSGATMLGARCLGMSRRSAARFSFFMAIPTMLGASLIKTAGFVGYVIESRTAVPPICIAILAVAFSAAFAVSALTLRFLISFTSAHGFTPFGVYRILLALAVVLYFTFIR